MFLVLFGAYLLHSCRLLRCVSRAGVVGLVFRRPSWGNGPHRFPDPRSLRVMNWVVAETKTKTNKYPMAKVSGQL